MALNLMYITNQPQVAKIAEHSGVDRIFVDMEFLGKDQRQAGLDTVKSHHTIRDIRTVRSAISQAELLVRVNPIHPETDGYMDSSQEINEAICAGADVLMLPMFRSLAEVEQFLSIVNGRAKTMLLAETREAVRIMPELIRLSGFDEIHIGLNDLHLESGKKFMFELLADGTVDSVCRQLKESGKCYGFGGIARIGYGLLPAEYIIREHYRLGSTRAILSRSFCNIGLMNDMGDVERLFETEMIRIRDTEAKAASMSRKEHEENHRRIIELVQKITETM